MLKPILNDRLIYSDINIDFTPVNNDITIDENDRAVIGAIKNIFSTNTGERLFNPNFGFKIKRFLGSPISDLIALELQESLVNNLLVLENRISSLNISVEPDEDNKQYLVLIEFIPSFSDIRRNISFSLNLNR